MYDLTLKLTPELAERLKESVRLSQADNLGQYISWATAVYELIIKHIADGGHVVMRDITGHDEILQTRPTKY